MRKRDGMMKMMVAVLTAVLAGGQAAVLAEDGVDRRIADLKSAFEEITDSFRQRAVDLEQKGAKAVTERDAALAARDAALAVRDTVQAERDAAVDEHRAAVAERDAAVAERDAVRVQAARSRETLKAQEALLAEQDAELAALRAAQAGNDGVLKARDEEIARLRQALVAAQHANARERFALAYNLGNIYKAARQYDRAEAQFVKALEMNADDPALHYNLGILYDDNLGNARKARQHYERFLQLAPNDPDAPNVVKWLKEL